MTIGQWLGKIAGQWLGSTGEVDPNALSGSASFSIGATGTLVNGAGVTVGALSGTASLTISATGKLVNSLERQVEFARQNSNRARIIAEDIEIMEIIMAIKFTLEAQRNG